MGFKTVIFFSKSKKTTGKIVRLNSNSSTTSNYYTFAPVVEYSVNGKDYLHESAQYSRRYRNKQSFDIVVHYDPKNPSYCIVGTVFDFMVIELIAVFIGSIALVSGLLGFKA